MSGWTSYIYSSIFGSSVSTISTIPTQASTKYGWNKAGQYYKSAEKYIFSNTHLSKIIKLVDFREECPPIYDQGHLGSCTANALAFCYQYDELHQKELSEFTPSRLFIYYNERNMEGHVLDDSGAEIHDGVQVMNTLGVCNETEWVYDISKFTIKPDENCYTNALLHKTSAFRPIQQELSQLRAALIAGFPVVFGFSVYESFESPDVAKTGNMPIPQPSEKLLGGHAVSAVGFDDTRQVFIVRNSWGASWGDKGYFYMPYAFITNPDMASDFWTITAIQDNVSMRAYSNSRILRLINETNEFNGANRIPSPIPECIVYKRNRNKPHKQNKN